MRDLQKLRKLLLSAVAAVEQYGTQPFLCWADSQAGHDMTEQEYALPHLPNVGLWTVTHASRSFMLSADMIRGMAELLPHRGAALSRLALMRPAQAAAAKCAYVADTSVDGAERIRRWANCSLDSTIEAANLYPEGHSERSSLQVELSNYASLATQLGEPMIVRRPRHSGLVAPRSIGHHPSEMGLIKLLRDPKLPDSDIAMYKVSSSVIHGHEQAQHVRFEPGKSIDDASDTVMSIRCDPHMEPIYLATALIYFLVAARKIAAYKGYDSEEISPYVVKAVEIIREALLERREDMQRSPV
jgi:hypothetical protein